MTGAPQEERPWAKRVHHLPSRRGGGGGGGQDPYDELVARAWNDERLPPRTRELVLLLAWLTRRDPRRHDPPEEREGVWHRAFNLLGYSGTGPGGRPKPRLADLLSGDAPGYRRPPQREWRCRAPMIRREGECGQHAPYRSYLVDRFTGWWEAMPYCNRHKEWGRRLEVALKALHKQGMPEPIPNTGGMLPTYFTQASGRDGWVYLYRWGRYWHAEKNWEPPKRYSIRADEWPAPGAEEQPQPEGPVRLRLVAKDGETQPEALISTQFPLPEQDIP